MTAKTVGLTHSRRVILKALVQREFVPIESLIDLLWGHDPNGGPDDPLNVIRVHMAFVRRFLERFGVIVETSRGLGYRIPSAQMRETAHEAMIQGIEERWSDQRRSSTGEIVGAVA